MKCDNLDVVTSTLCNFTNEILFEPSEQDVNIKALFFLTLGILLSLPAVFNTATKQHEKREKVSKRDLLWYISGEKNEFIVNGVMMMEPITLEALHNTFRNHFLAKHPRFQQKIVYENGTPFWQHDEEFDIYNHIYEVEDEQLKKGATKEQLQQHIGNFFNRKLSPDRPLFEFILFPNYEGKQSAVFCRIHHVVGDGMALMAALFGASDPVELNDDDKKYIKKRETKRHSLLSLSIRVALSSIFKVIPVLFQFADDNPLHASSNSTLSGKRNIAWCNSVLLENVKIVKNELRCTVNDILMACATRAFRKYFLVKNNGECSTKMRFCLPINMRSRKQLDNIQMQNNFVVVILSCPTDKEKPMETLEDTISVMNHLKTSVEPIAYYSGQQILVSVSSYITKVIMNLFCNKTTAVLSNVPGPKNALKYCGRSVHDMYFFPPATGNCAVSVSILSYTDKIQVGIAADSGVCDESDLLVRYFSEEFENYMKIAKELKNK